jgi:enterochelin esterase-like enzyme
MDFLLDISIVSWPLVTIVYSLAAITILALIVRRPSKRWSRRAWYLTAAAAAAIGTLIGLGVIWLFVDVDDAFGVSFTETTRLWICLGFAAVAVALVGFLRSGWRRKIASALAIILFVTAAATAINVDFGQYATVRAALGITAFSASGLPIGDKTNTSVTLAEWTPPADLPAKGSISSIEIPGLLSKFPARNANVYLPPAALTAKPPKLPVVILLSGQPGSPDDPFVSGKIESYLDSFAAAHNGLAPIVVVPDQLSAPEVNPMCVDSPLGNSATYITQDVPNWIKANLPVLTDRTQWAIAGFSQGGTCAIQFGAGFPELFGNLIDVSGELVPTVGDPVNSINGGFGGSEAAYVAAQPLSILAAKAPYPDSYASFSVGELDTRFKPGVQQLYQAALAAGMKADYVESPGTAHDWTTGTFGLQSGFDSLFSRWGLNT